MRKEESLQKLKEKVAADLTIPLRESNLVFGEGDANAAVVFVGEAPGFHEDRLGRPFVGRAGQLLDELIRGVGWKREEVYITNIIKRRPPENRDPLPGEIEAYAPHLALEIDIINPRLIVPLGRFAMDYFLPDAKITRDHGKLFRLGNRLIIPFFHPAAALRSTQVLRVLREDFKKLPAIAADGAAPEAIEVSKAAEAPPRPQNKLF